MARRPRITPVGAPDSFLAIRQPLGASKFSSIPARFRARLFRIMSRYDCWMNTGLCGAALSSSAFVNTPGLSRNWPGLHPPMMSTHSPGLSDFALAEMTASAFLREVTPSILASCSQRSAWRMKCTWLSIRPGISVLPCRSMTFVLEPTSERIRALLPTDTIRSPRIATACWVEKSASTVNTFPFTKAISADWEYAEVGKTPKTTKMIANTLIFRLIRSPRIPIAILHKSSKNQG